MLWLLCQYCNYRHVLPPRVSSFCHLWGRTIYHIKQTMALMFNIRKCYRHLTCAVFLRLLPDHADLQNNEPGHNEQADPASDQSIFNIWGGKTTSGHRLTTRCNVTPMTEQNVKSDTRRLMFTTPDTLICMKGEWGRMFDFTTCLLQGWSASQSWYHAPSC